MKNNLRDDCNNLYIDTLALFNDDNNYVQICKNLLEIASMLLEIAKTNFSLKKESEEKALKIFNIAKELRLSKDIKVAYYKLTGEVLKEKTKEKGNQNSRDEKHFNWISSTNVSFSDVSGLEEVKDVVLKKVILPLINPKLYEGYEKSNNGGVLLYGPPGTGKTMIAAAIANEINAKFCTIGVSDIVLGGIGNSEKAIKQLFEEARSFRCSVIFFDEAESICPVNTKAQHAKQIRSELLRQMQGLESYCNETNNILFLIAATNKPWLMDNAFLRPGRFGNKIYVGLPDVQARKNMIEKLINRIKNNNIVEISEDIDYEYIVEKTEGFNGADIANLIEEVQEYSIMRSIETNKKIICFDDFLVALNKIVPSVNKDDLLKYQEWIEGF